MFLFWEQFIVRLRGAPLMHENMECGSLLCPLHGSQYV